MPIRPQLCDAGRSLTLRSMKTILWATLSANGNYARGTARHAPKPEALADFAEQARTYGNFVVGRRTFTEFQENASRRPANAGALTADIVVLSSQLALPAGAPAVVARSPREALERVKERGHATALVVGGEAVHNAFLAEGLVDEVIMVVAPFFEDAGLKLVLRAGERREAKLLESQSIGGGHVRLRYALGPADAW
jgi:dihydrofolate reductase